MNERISVTLEIVKKCPANIQIQNAGTKVASQDAKSFPAADLGRWRDSKCSLCYNMTTLIP